MATTIKSTELDFNTIKNNLKTFLAQSDEFADYNFEASGLSSLLDVMAYNTHYNSLLANFALNESFLPTAQLRSSLVSLAGGLGYTVGSKNASCASINLYVVNPLFPSSMTLPAGFKLTTSVNNKSYTFKTRQTLTATNNGANQYFFQLGENRNVAIHEGTQKRNIFIAGPAKENESYVLPTQNLDLNTVQVRVYTDVSTTFYDVYNNLNDTVNIDKNSKIFVIKETPNGDYELTFGNGAKLGQFPDAGNKIEVIYDQVAGAEANGARTFQAVDAVFDGNGESLPVVITTVKSATAGSEKEEIASIRKNAPYLYAAQNRMVTAKDYASLILRSYGNVITDIKSWGGEDSVPANYGSVYVSIVFNTQDTTIQDATKTGVIDLAKNLSVASFDVNFTDPLTTFLQVNSVFQWNPTLTSSSQTAIETLVTQTVENYFNDQLGGFDKSFRRSNLLTLIDDADPSILSSRAEITMQYRFIPTVGQSTYSLIYPASIAAPDDTNYIVRSDIFTIDSRNCFLRNRLNSNVIEVIDASQGTTFIDNIGEYDETTGVISLSGWSGTLATATPYLKITARPANQATINAQRNNVLAFDTSASNASSVITDTV